MHVCVCICVYVCALHVATELLKITVCVHIHTYAYIYRAYHAHLISRFYNMGLYFERVALMCDGL